MPKRQRTGPNAEVLNKGRVTTIKSGFTSRLRIRALQRPIDEGVNYVSKAWHRATLAINLIVLRALDLDLPYAESRTAYKAGDAANVFPDILYASLYLYSDRCQDQRLPMLALRDTIWMHGPVQSFHERKHGIRLLIAHAQFLLL